MLGVGQEKDVKEGTKIVLTKPTSLEAESDAAEYKAPNPLQRLLSLIKDLRPGSDLTRLQIPAHFNMPKSQLQCYGECVYGFKEDMLSKCNEGKSPVDRFIAVVAWTVSTLRPLVLGSTPYNPILGETHHVSRGTLNVLLEQISHHPPVSALHATDEEQNIEMLWCHNAAPKFCGNSVEVEMFGKRHLKLLKYGETYLWNCPKLMFHFLPIPGSEWGGNVFVQCPESGMRAEICCKGLSFLGRKANNRSIKGNIFYASFPNEPLYEINGHWDRIVTLRGINNGKVTDLYHAKQVISGMKAPVVEDPKGVWPSESAVVWSDVSQGILGNDWEQAKTAKRAVEEKQRELARERKTRNEIWVPKHFTISYSKETGWECSPVQKFVPRAPIVVPP